MELAAFEFIVEGPPIRLDLFLSRQTGQSRVMVQSQVKKGRVHVNGAVAPKAATLVRDGDKISGEFPRTKRPSLNLYPPKAKSTFYTKMKIFWP